MPSQVKRLEELERTENMYHGVVEHLKKVLKAFFELCRVHKGIKRHGISPSGGEGVGVD